MVARRRIPILIALASQRSQSNAVPNGHDTRSLHARRTSKAATAGPRHHGRTTAVTPGADSY